MSKWLLPLMLVGLIGCASETLVGRWQGTTPDGNRVLLDVSRNGIWAAETIVDDGTRWQESGRWVYTATDKATFMQEGEVDPGAQGSSEFEMGQAILMDPNRLILRTDTDEVHFRRR